MPLKGGFCGRNMKIPDQIRDKIINQGIITIFTALDMVGIFIDQGGNAKAQAIKIFIGSGIFCTVAVKNIIIQIHTRAADFGQINLNSNHDCALRAQLMHTVGIDDNNIFTF